VTVFHGCLFLGASCAHQTHTKSQKLELVGAVKRQIVRAPVGQRCTPHSEPSGTVGNGDLGAAALGLALKLKQFTTFGEIEESTHPGVKIRDTWGIY
jgi:hypothetical protein